MYNHKKIEKKWKETWEDSGIYKTREDDSREKYYILDMFPYPSGAGLHVGHPKGYIATDIFARLKTMQGFNVLHPMGWDAFGLPAENYAIKNKVHPSVSTNENIETFKRQLGLLGFSYDWEREIDTTDPEFYKWTQWIFLEMFKRGLAFESFDPINWCPSCKTGLANEDLEGGKCERCGSLIERRPMRQWVLRITDYADRMLEDLEELPEWDDSIKEMQRNWIGRSVGAKVKFPVIDSLEKQKIKKIYFATGNESKLRRMQKLFSRVDADIVIEKVPDYIDVPEVCDNGLDNSRDKVMPYEGKYDAPVIANDTSFFMEGEDFDPTHVKRTALGGLTENDLSQEQIAEKMKDYYIAIAKKYGGKKDFYFKYDWSMLMPDGKVVQISSRKECVLTDKLYKELDIYFPIRSLYYSRETGKNVSEQNEEEYFLEFRTQINSFKLLLARATSLETLEVFTTRPDTLFGATYMVIAPEHELIENWKLEIENWKEVKAYVKQAANKSDLERAELNKDKTGVKLDGLTAVNPVNGAEIPVYVADYVLAGYGTGAIMAVPAHDERDYEFAEKYNIKIEQVVKPTSIEDVSDYAKAVPASLSDDGRDIFEKIENYQKDAFDKLVSGEIVYCYARDGITVNSGFLDGLKTADAKQKIIEILVEDNSGESAINYKLRDWVFSRQRYWGEPIPIIHCAHCKEKIEKEAYAINFRNQDTWKRLVRGIKTVETRALNPDEMDRYFGDIGEGDYIKAINKKTEEEQYLKVKRVKQYEDLEELSRDKDTLTKVVAPGVIPETVVELEQHYSFVPNYVERINKNGLVAWEVELIFPGIVPVPEKDLPVTLPEVEHYEPTGTGESPLAGIDEWVNTSCPECGGDARRETNTMPQWAGSSWYYLRFIDPYNSESLVDKQKEKYWSPVDFYVGGAEHATRHLIYARFWHKFLYDIGAVSHSEPFTRLQHVGLIMAEDGRKMSKRWGNVINPDDIVAEYGADAMRVYEMFMGPFSQACAWNTKGLVGARKFLEKIWKIKDVAQASGETSKKILNVLHKTIKKVAVDIESFKFNTAISAMMILVNTMEKEKQITKTDFKKFITILAPFAPHLCEEIWADCGETTSIFKETWPEFDAALAHDEKITLAVQVNGKLRDTLEVDAEIDEAVVKELALSSEKIKSWTEGKNIVKVIYVRGKLVSVVLK